jgi:cell division protein FtsL
MLKRIGLAAATAFIAVNIWTGCPIVALWVGAQVVQERRVTMTAIFVIVAVLAVLVYASAVVLAWLNASYDALIGRPHVERRPTWLRSMRDEAEGYVAQRVGITPLERVVMLNVYVAVILLAVWYVFFAGPPLLHN